MSRHLNAVPYGPGRQSRDEAVAQITTLLVNYGMDPASGSWVDCDADGDGRQDVRWDPRPDGVERQANADAESAEREAYNVARDDYRMRRGRGELEDGEMPPAPPGAMSATVPLSSMQGATETPEVEAVDEPPRADA